MSDAPQSLEAIAAELSHVARRHRDCGKGGEAAFLERLSVSIRSHAQNQSEDTKRLNELESRFLQLRWRAYGPSTVWLVFEEQNHGHYRENELHEIGSGDSVREAIDAALRSESKGGQG